MAEWRGRNIGVVFQFFQLLPTLSIVDNVMLPMDFCHKYSPRERREKAMGLLELVGMAEQARKLPTAISGGQQQRVAIARAIVNEPAIIMADEPTGNLDSHVGKEIMALLLNLNKERGTTLIIITHDPTVGSQAQRIIRIRDGVVEGSEDGK